MSLQVLLLGGFGAWLLYWPGADLGRRPARGRLNSGKVARERISIDEFELFVRQISALLSGGVNEFELWRSLAAVNRPSGVAGLAEECAVRSSAGLASSAVFRELAAGMPARDPVRVAAVELAACVELASRNGVPMAEVMGRLAGHLDAAAEVRGLQRTAMAGPAATATLLSWLPVLGLAAGYLMGIDPIGASMSSPLGLVAFVIGLVLLAAGRLWMSALLRSAGARR